MAPAPHQKTLYLTRHAQAEHNVAEDYTIRDAPLTKLGREQSKALNEDTKDTFQQTAQLLVSSPLRRPMQTLLDGYPLLLSRLNNQVSLLPQLQEVNAHPCDTGSAREDLEEDEEFAMMDFSGLTEEWTSKKGKYDPRNVGERAKWVREWLRNREEMEIVVVAHGDILRVLTDNDQYSGAEWLNAQVKPYTFLSASDPDARLVQLDPKTGAKLGGEVKEGGDGPTSSEITYEESLSFGAGRLYSFITPLHSATLLRGHHCVTAELHWDSLLSKSLTDAPEPRFYRKNASSTIQHPSSGGTSPAMSLEPHQKTIYLTRHSQAEHNIANDYSIRDPLLTELGREQSANLNDRTKDTLQRTA